MQTRQTRGGAEESGSSDGDRTSLDLPEGEPVYEKDSVGDKSDEYESADELGKGTPFFSLADATKHSIPFAWGIQ